MADARPHPGWLAELWNPSLADSHGRYINQSKRAIMIRQLAHLNFVTNDLSKIIDFYVNKLGMNVKFTLDNKEGKPFGYYFGCGNTTFLEFFDQAMAIEVWGGKVEELISGTRYRHFCLEVTGLDEYCQSLVSKGVDVTEITMGMDHSRQAWITNPDGNSIELMEYGYSRMQLTR